MSASSLVSVDDDSPIDASSRNERSIADNDNEEMQGLKSPIRVNSLWQKPHPSSGEESGPLLIPDEAKNKRPPQDMLDDEALKRKETNVVKISAFSQKDGPEVYEDGNEDMPKVTATALMYQKGHTKRDNSAELEPSDKKMRPKAKLAAKAGAAYPPQAAKTTVSAIKPAATTPYSKAAYHCGVTLADNQKPGATLYSKAAYHCGATLADHQKPGAFAVAGTEQEAPQVSVPEDRPYYLDTSSLAAAYADEDDKGISLAAGAELDPTPDKTIPILATDSAGMTSSPLATQGEYVPKAMADVHTAVTYSSIPEQHEQDGGYTHIVAELAPDEKDLEDRVAERLQQQMDQVLAERLEEERKTQVVAEEVILVLPKQQICGMSRNIFMIVACFVFLVVIGVVTGVVVALTGNDGGDAFLAITRFPTEEPTQTPSFAPTKLFRSERFEMLLVMLSPSITVDNDTSFLRDPETVQSLALEWLADEDLAQLDLKETPLETFLERYALAVLFLGTLGESWRDSLEFLNSTSVCEWNDNSGGSSRGVNCDQEAGSVIELRLSKFELCVHIEVFGYHVFD
jgi:hypothetical protein